MRAIIFIPGYKGSFLRSSLTKQRVWLKTRHTLGMSTSLAYQHNNPENIDPLNIIPDGVFDRLNLVPGFIVKDIYHKFFSVINKSLQNVQLIPFDYDWRADYWQQVSRLDQMIIKLRNDGIETIDIIAHSLGGLIAAYYLRYGTQSPEKVIETWAGAQNIRRIVFTAVPFRGTLKSIHDLFLGESIGINRSILNKPTLRTFPIAYELLPLGRALLDKDERAIDLFSVEEWQNLRMGIYNDDYIETMYAQAFAQALHTGKQLFDCHHKPLLGTSPSHLKILNIIGNSLPTHSQMTWDSKAINSKLKLKIATYADGDGTVVCQSAQLPEAWIGTDYSVKWSANDHTGLFHSKDVQSSILEFLQ